MARDQFRAILRGKDATLGVIRARDVSRLILGLESAVAAGAYAALGVPRRSSTGRHPAAIEAASTLHFQGLEAGSVVAVLRLPQLAEVTEATFDMRVDDLAVAAFNRMVASFSLPDDQVDAGIAGALANLGQDLGIGERHDELLLMSTRTADAHFNAAVSERMRRLADPPLGHQPDVLVGTLREADFDRRTARLHVSTGETVRVDFPAGLEEQIQEALRAQAAFTGIVTFDPKTTAVQRVQLSGLNTAEPLPYESSVFGLRPTSRISRMRKGCSRRPSLAPSQSGLRTSAMTSTVLWWTWTGDPSRRADRPRADRHGRRHLALDRRP